MKLNKKTSIPLLLTLAGGVLGSMIPANAYQPIEVKIPFTFKNFEYEDAKNYSLTINEKGSSKVSTITYNIASSKTQYYTLSFNEPGSYLYEITYSAFGEKEVYDVDIEIYTQSNDNLYSGLFITKKGETKKTDLEFEEKDETPSEKPSTTPSSPSSIPSTTPSSNPSETPSETPSTTPSSNPSWTPSETPSTTPSVTPSGTPSGGASVEPSVTPSETPSENPSVTPSTTPSVFPSWNPSIGSSTVPSNDPMTPSSTPNTPSYGGPSYSNPSHGVQTGDNYLPIFTIGGIASAFLALGVYLFKRKK